MGARVGERASRRRASRGTCACAPGVPLHGCTCSARRTCFPGCTSLLREKCGKTLARRGVPCRVVSWPRLPVRVPPEAWLLILQRAGRFDSRWPLARPCSAPLKWKIQVPLCGRCSVHCRPPPARSLRCLPPCPCQLSLPARTFVLWRAALLLMLPLCVAACAHLLGARLRRVPCVPMPVPSHPSRLCFCPGIKPGEALPYRGPRHSIRTPNFGSSRHRRRQALKQSWTGREVRSTQGTQYRAGGQARGTSEHILGAGSAANCCRAPLKFLPGTLDGGRWGRREVHGRGLCLVLGTRSLDREPCLTLLPSCLAATRTPTRPPQINPLLPLTSRIHQASLPLPPFLCRPRLSFAFFDTRRTAVQRALSNLLHIALSTPPTPLSHGAALGHWTNLPAALQARRLPSSDTDLPSVPDAANFLPLTLSTHLSCPFRRRHIHGKPASVCRLFAPSIIPQRAAHVVSPSYPGPDEPTHDSPNASAANLSLSLCEPLSPPSITILYRPWIHSP